MNECTFSLVTRLSLPQWNLYSPLDSSDLSCRLTSYFQAMLTFGSQNEVVLMSLDRFLAVAYRGYYENLMRNRRYPVLCTLANYAITGIISIPTAFMVHIDSNIGVCFGSPMADNTWGVFYKRIVVLVILFAIPCTMMFIFNLYTVYIIR